MPAKHEAVAPAIPFEAEVRVASLDPQAETPVERRLTEAECTALARFLGIEGVAALGFAGGVRRWGDKGWEVAGRLEAVVTQACVVSLEPVEERVDTAVVRRYMPGAEQLAPDTVELGPEDLPADDADEIEGFGDSIDLAALMVESLALALEPYPRAPGAAFDGHLHAAPGVTPLSDEAMRPFSQLAALKQRLEAAKGGSSGD